MSAPRRTENSNLRAEIAAAKVDADKKLAEAKEMAGRGMERAWALLQKDGGLFADIFHHLQAVEKSVQVADEGTARLNALKALKALKRPALKKYASTSAVLVTLHPAPGTQPTSEVTTPGLPPQDVAHLMVPVAELLPAPADQSPLQGSAL